MQYKSIVIVFVIVFIASCKKPVMEPQQILKQVKKISSSATDFRSFTYDSEKRLTSHTLQFRVGNETTTFLVNYSYINGIINTASSQGGSVFYETEGQQVKVVRSFRPMGSEISTINFSYNNKGQLIEWREKINQPEPDQPKETKQSFEYFADGNIMRVMYYVKMTTDGPFVLNGSTEYDQYDQFKNADISFSGTV